MEALGGDALRAWCAKLESLDAHDGMKCGTQMFQKPIIKECFLTVIYYSIKGF